MSRFMVVQFHPRERFPRVSGDDPDYRFTATYLRQFSPRERG